MRRLASPGLRLSIALLAVSALSGCALPAVGATTTMATTTTQAAATVTVPGTPPGWNVYHGDHFTIAYPPQWSYSATAPTQTGSDTSSVLTLSGPQPRDQIQIAETAFTQDEISNFCATTGQTATHLAGLPMFYQVVEGVHRQWTFVSAKRISYGLSAFDADQSTTMQTQDDSILATFQPDDRTPSCP